MIPKVTIAILDLSVKSDRSGHRMDLVDQEVDLVDQEGDLEVDLEDPMDPEEGLVDQVEDLDLVDQVDEENSVEVVEAKMEAVQVEPGLQAYQKSNLRNQKSLKLWI